MDGTGIAIRNFAIRSNLTSTDSDEKLVGEGEGGGWIETAKERLCSRQRQPSIRVPERIPDELD